MNDRRKPQEMGEWAQQFQVMTKSLGPDILEQFPRVEGRYSNFIREVCFVRYVGVGDEKVYLEKLCNMDRGLNRLKKEKQRGYLRIRQLENRLLPERTGIYIGMFENFQKGREAFPFHFENRMWEEALGRNYGTIIQLYRENSGKTGEHFVRNFGVKLIYWMENYFPKLFLETMKMRQFPKFVCGGEIKLQEYLFLYFLVLMGCDVLYLNPEKDVQVESEVLLKLSCLVEEGSKKKMEVPLEFSESCLGEETRRNMSPGMPQTASHMPGQGKASGNGTAPVRMDIPPHPGRSRTAPTAGGGEVRGEPCRAPVGGGYRTAPAFGGNRTRPATALPGSRPPVSGSVPLDYVDLAKRASSVVMIGVYNKNKECLKTGSGVIISDRGFILTNFHVACEAAYYGIRLEEEEHIFFTDELIKYNQYHDLAILRVDRPRAPIPIYQGGQDLVRGQKVVAIGSPLGLFNTVSDGIISGFRKMEDVSMIQFTAPTSHGSSGGALLDLYGNLIGVITAGYDDGQNLNLAVDYQTVWMFAKGFV